LEAELYIPAFTTKGLVIMSSLIRYATALQNPSTDFEHLMSLTEEQRSMIHAVVSFLSESLDYRWDECIRTPALRALLDASVVDRRAALVCFSYIQAGCINYQLQNIMRELLGRDDALDVLTAREVLKVLVEHEYDKHLDNLTSLFVGHLEVLYKRDGLAGLEDEIRVYLERNTRFWSKGREPRILQTRLKQMLGEGQELRLPLDSWQATWVDHLQADFAQLPEAEQRIWMNLIDHGVTGSGSSPSSTWLKKATKLASDLPPGALSQTLARWFTCLHLSGVGMTEANETTIKSLVWLAGIGEPKLLAPRLGDMSVTYYAKVEWQGPRSRILGNACIQILCLLDKPGVVQLSRLRSKIRYSQGKALIEKSVIKAAERAGLTPDDMEEASVPDMGFDAEGIARFTFGNSTALLRLEGEGRLTTEWYNAEGKVLKSVPAEVKRDHGDAFKGWQKENKAFADALLGQRTRFEQAYLRQRVWRLEEWHQRFIDSNELLGWMGRRLIWNIERDGGIVQVIGLEGGLRDLDGNCIADLPGDSRVTLWHPTQATAQQVLAWREKLQQLQIQQPIRQAFREVYLLTDAERASGTASRRFSGHLLRQFQLNSLLSERGWSYALQGSWDGHNNPYKVLQRWGLSVEFEIEPKDEFSDVQGGTGVYVYVESGEFYFSSAEVGVVSLADVPPLLFSEILRDMDLFVGVCSVANDPERGLVDDPAFTRYISVASEAELQGGAQVRRDLLDNILSRLPIAKRCSLDGRYLVVKGDLRTYRIHLGSSNILMEPNNQYLCIVQDKNSKSAATGIYLPFEGDMLLSLILSKALLLANDRKIKDQSILSQINA
jgi:hypothetical protein